MYIALSSQQGSVYWISLSKFTWFDQNEKTKITLTPHTHPEISTDTDYMNTAWLRNTSLQHILIPQGPQDKLSMNQSVSSVWSKVISCQYLDSMINSRAVRYQMGGYGGLDFLSDQAGPIFPKHLYPALLLLLLGGLLLGGWGLGSLRGLRLARGLGRG